MKTTKMMTCLAFLTVISVIDLKAQENQKFRIVIHTEKNGERIDIDTSFTSREEMNTFLKSRGLRGGEEFEFDFNFEGETPSEDEMKELKQKMQWFEYEFKDSPGNKQKVKSRNKSGSAESGNSSENVISIDVEKEMDHHGEGKIIIRKIKGEKGEGKEQRKVIFISKDDGQDGDVKIIRHFDSNDNHQPAIKKIVVKDPQENSPSSVQNETTVSKPVNPENYKLALNDFKIFPNPSQGKVEISFQSGLSEPVEITILDASGRTVIEEIFPAPGGTFHQSFELNEGSRGTYLVQIRQGEKWHHEKVILK
jgi:hypothetical protein